jgi:hypothetical protein
MQVWLGREMVGRLEAPIPRVDRLKAACWTEIDEENSLTREIAISIATLKARLTRFESVRFRDEQEVKAHLVEKYNFDLATYRVEIDPNADAQIYSWDVLQPRTTDEYEFLFDQREFEPHG